MSVTELAARALFPVFHDPVETRLPEENTNPVSIGSRFPPVSDAGARYPGLFANPSLQFVFVDWIPDTGQRGQWRRFPELPVAGSSGSVSALMPTQAEPIIAAFCDQTDSSILWESPASNNDVVRIARSLGFAPVGDLTRMWLGENCSPVNI